MPTKLVLFMIVKNILSHFTIFILALNNFSQDVSGGITTNTYESNNNMSTFGTNSNINGNTNNTTDVYNNSNSDNNNTAVDAVNATA